MIIILNLRNHHQYARSYPDMVQNIFWTLIDGVGVQDFREVLHDNLTKQGWDEARINALNFKNQYETQELALEAINNSVEIKNVLDIHRICSENVMLEYNEKTGEVLAELPFTRKGEQNLSLLDFEDSLFDSEEDDDFVVGERIEIEIYDEEGNKIKPNINWFLYEQAIDKYLKELEKAQVSTENLINQALSNYFTKFEGLNQKFTTEGLSAAVREYFLMRIRLDQGEKISKKYLHLIDTKDFKKTSQEILELFQLDNFKCVISWNMPVYPVWIDQENEGSPQKDTYEFNDIRDWAKKNILSPGTNTPFCLLNLRAGFNPYRVQEIMDNFLNQEMHEIQSKKNPFFSHALLEAKSFINETKRLSFSGFFGCCKRKAQVEENTSGKDRDDSFKNNF